MKKSTLIFCLLLAVTLSNVMPGSLFAQEKVFKFPFSNFDRWIVRDLKESGIIGGNEKRIYAIGATDTVAGNNPLIPAADAVWGTSNVYAKVMGVVKGSCSVFPEERGNGYCVRMETVLEHVKAMGMFNIRVIATGSLFLGHIVEPVSDTKDPMAKLMQGMPYTGHPKALRFDYKVKTGGARQKASGMGKPTDLDGKNAAEVSLLLQKRWEDKDGNVYAKRIGTAFYRFEKNQNEWVNGFSLPINYGDITQKTDFVPSMDLIQGDDSNHCLNSNGKAARINEIEWGDANDTPTHIVLRFSSGNGGAYIGAVGDILWIDNVVLVEQ